MGRRKVMVGGAMGTLMVLSGCSLLGPSEKVRLGHAVEELNEVLSADLHTNGKGTDAEPRELLGPELED